MSDLTPFETRARNKVTINKVKKDLPFCTRFYNRPSVDTIINSPSCTDKSLKESTDINLIVARHTKLGVPLPSVDTALYNLTADNVQTGEAYGTVTNITERLLVAKNNFMTLPSKLRAKFDNDVSKFADFLSASSDSKINDLLSAYGLKKEEDAPAVGNQDIKEFCPPTDNQESVSP